MNSHSSIVKSLIFRSITGQKLGSTYTSI